MTSVDLNEGMIKKAKELTHTEISNYDWRVADAEALPFDAGAFSLIICQQGIQYFPNQQAVLEELHRVAAKPGRLVISVWAGASDFFKAMAASVGQHVDHETGQKYLAPFSYYDVDVLPDMLARAGFKEVKVKKLTVDRRMENISSNILGEILGHTAGQKVKDAGEPVVQAISNEVIAACSKYQRGNDMIVPQQAYLFTATAKWRD
jgi:SAM-dependent methyltransferase